MKKDKLIILIVVFILLFVSYYSIYKKDDFQETTTVINNDQYSVSELVSGLDRPWGIAFLPSGDILFTQRINKISLIRNGQKIDLNSPQDTFVNGEGGMMAVAVDPSFDENSYVYACFNSKMEDNNPKIIVSRFVLDIEAGELSNRKDIVSDIPANSSGRHSGCQLEFGPDGYLWIGTGDTAQQPVPQDPKSLGGKILKVDRNGASAEGNLGGEFDPRIFSYGHRNTQGLGFFTNESHKKLVGISIEHGPSVDDEVNFLIKGNFGWDPLPYYGEDVPMTDKDKFPEAIDAMWESGYPTIAASGGTIINSEKWGKWQNSIAIAALKGSHIRLLSVDQAGNITDEVELFENIYGRFRTIREGPTGALYMLTDNGKGNDRILVLEPN